MITSYFYEETLPILKIRDIITNGLDLDKLYLDHDLEQHSTGFSTAISRTPWIMLMPANL